MAKTKISWTKFSWNPMHGCHAISPACDNCYAKHTSEWLKGMGTPGYVHTFRTTVQPEKFNDPFTWRKLRLVFVCSMGDFFLKEYNKPTNSKAYAHQINLLEIMVHPKNKKHTFQVLTKRSENMLECIELFKKIHPEKEYWLENVWFGVTVENQKWAEKRIPDLLALPVKNKFLSVEPMLGPIDLGKVEWKHNAYFKVSGRTEGALTDPDEFCDYSYFTKLGEGIQWVIVGGESGKNARPMHPRWIMDLKDQCKKGKVPFFFKQWGEWADRSGIYCGTKFSDIDPMDKKWRTVKLCEHNKNVWIEDCDHENCTPIYMSRVGKKKAGSQFLGEEIMEFPKGIRMED